MKTFFNIIVLLLFPLWGKTNDTTHFHSYLKLGSGMALHADLDPFNSALESQNIAPLSPFTLSTVIQGKVRKNNSSVHFNFSIQNLSNGVQRPETQVIFNLYHFSINYGTDLLHENRKLSLEPFIGIGGTFGDFFIFSQDSTQTFTEALNGAQNLFYEQPSIAFMAEAGLRLEIGIPDKRIAYFFELNALHQFNDWKWKTTNMQLNQLTAIRLNLGCRFKLF
jgi:hypothetical protein